MQLFKPNDLRNANLLWYVVGQFLYYHSEKHNLLMHIYHRMYENLVHFKGEPYV